MKNLLHIKGFFFMLQFMRKKLGSVTIAMAITFIVMALSSAAHADEQWPASQTVLTSSSTGLWGGDYLPFFPTSSEDPVLPPDDDTPTPTANLSGATIILYDVAFSGGSDVYLKSFFGTLAPSPDTGDVSAPGYVNFISGVNYSGIPTPPADPNPIQIGQDGTGTGISPSFVIQAVPEPSTFALAGLGLGLITLVRRAKSK